MVVGLRLLAVFSYSLLIYLPHRVSVCGDIYLFLLRVKADAVTVDRGMLSVSRGAQFSAFVLPVNCFCLVSLFFIQLFSSVAYLNALRSTSIWGNFYLFMYETLVYYGLGILVKVYV